MKIERLTLMFFLLVASANFAVAQTATDLSAKANESTSVLDFLGGQIGGKYTNPFFGFKFAAPPNYPFVETEQAKLLNKAGADIIGGGNAQAAKKIDESMARQSNLFALSQFPLGTPGNAVLEAAVVKQSSSITSNMALAASVALYTRNPNFKVEKALGDVKFGGKIFAGTILGGTVNDVPIKIDLYVIMRRGYSVVFGVTYTSEDGRSKMIDIMNSIEFTQ